MKFNKEIIICANLTLNVCPKKWDNLANTAEECIRFCGSCKHQVYFCDTPEEVMRHAQQSRCVAYACVDSEELPIVYVGRPPDPEAYRKNAYPSRPMPTPKQAFASKLSSKESEMYSVLKNATITTRRCANCHAPMPSWYSSCKICDCLDTIEKSDSPL